MTATISKGRLIPAAILAILVYGMIASLLGTILPRLVETPEKHGAVGLAQAIGLAIASVSVGPLIDNKGKKTGLLLGLTMIAVALFVLPSTAGNYDMVLALFLFLGLGGGIIVTASNALVSDISEERRASTLNLLNLFFGLGGMATPLIKNLLGGNVIILCYLIAALTAGTLVLHASTPMPPPTGERGFKTSEVGKVVGRPALFLLALFLFLYVASEVGVWNWLVRHLKAQNVAETTAGYILSFGFGLGLLVGRVGVSRVLIKIPSQKVTLGASVLMAITTYAMLQTSDPTLAGVLVFLAGVAMAPVFPTTLAMVGDAFPRMTATAMGIVITSGWIGLAVSSPIIGSIAGQDDARLKTALLVIPVASVIMIAVNMGLLSVLRKRQTA